MAKYECRVCGYVFDEQQAGESFDNVYSCPICDADKESFKVIEADDSDSDSKAEESTNEDDGDFFFEEADGTVESAGTKSYEKDFIDEVLEADSPLDDKKEEAEEEKKTFPFHVVNFDEKKEEDTEVKTETSEFTFGQSEDAQTEDKDEEIKAEETQQEEVKSEETAVEETKAEETVFEAANSDETQAEEKPAENVFSGWASETASKEALEAKEANKEENSESNNGGFVIEKRQEFWKKEDNVIAEPEEDKDKEEKGPTVLNYVGSVTRVIGEENSEKKEDRDESEKSGIDEGLISTFYSGTPVKTEEQLKAEEEAKNAETPEFVPLWGDGLGAIKKVVGAPEEKKEEVKVETTEDEEGVVYLNFEDDKKEDEVEVTESSESEAEDIELSESEAEPIESSETQATEDDFFVTEDDATSAAEETEAIEEEIKEEAVEEAASFEQTNEEDGDFDFVFEEASDDDVNETAKTGATPFVFAQFDKEEVNDTAKEENDQVSEEETKETEEFFEDADAAEENAEAVAEEEVIETAADDTTEAVAEETETAAEETVAETEAAVEENEATESAEEIVEEATETEESEAAETNDTAEANEAEVEASEETEDVEKAEEEEEEEERDYICLDADEELDGRPVAYSMLKRDTKYTVLYDTAAKRIFDDYPLENVNVSNGLENIILLPAQCNPLPLKRNARVETKTVIGALTACPVEVLQPFCFSKLFLWGEHIPNNSKPEKYANQALVLVKGEEGHIPNLSSKEELREEVEIAKARFNGTPVGIDLVAGRIEADLEACVYAKVDFVILNDVSSRILPYALRRARNYLNRVNSKLEILVCVEALKDAQELAKILALGANFVLVERGFDLDMANNMTEALKEICRSTGHNNVHDLNLEDICTIDTDLAMYTDISHV